MNTAYRVLSLFLLAAMFLAGCARAVKIISPADQSQHSPPVAFEVEVRGYNFHAELDGQDITPFFTLSGRRATASSAAQGFPALIPGSSHRLYTYAAMQPQPFQAVDHNDEVNFTMAPLPSLTLSPVSLAVDIGAQQTATAGIPGGAPANFALTFAPQNMRIGVGGQPAGATATLAVPAGATAQAFAVSGFQAGSSGVTVSGAGFQPGMLTVSVPAPAVELTVTPVNDSVPWGQSASYQIGLASRHGFSGTVNLTVDQLPAGVSQSLSAGSVTLGAGTGQNLSLNLATAYGASPLGTTAFRVRASSSAATVSENADLTIRRVDGAFVKRGNLSAPSTPCGPHVTATYQSVGLNDIRVTFAVNRPSGSGSTQAIPAIFYTLSQPSDCRIGVAMHPCQNAGCTGAGDPAFSWYNLGWEAATGTTRGFGDRIRNLTRINWHQFWFSADQSLLLLITKKQQAVGCPPTCPYLDMRAFLYDSITGSQLDQVDFRASATGSPSDPVANVTSANLSGGTVTLQYVNQNGNGDSRTLSLP